MKLQNKKATILCTCILFAWTIVCTLIVCTCLEENKADALSDFTTYTATATDAGYGIANINHETKVLAASKVTGCITYGTVGVYFRKTPGGEQIRHNGSVIMLNGGHPLEVLDTSNPAWYRVRLTYNGTSYTGYVASQYVYISSSPASSDASFEKMIADFPESYKPQLRELHKKHPNWIFNPVKTGLDWNTVVANEVNTSKAVKNTVQGTGSNPKYNWRSTTVGFDYATDKYKAFDGSTWFAASDALVTYYLDPRIYLYERSVFAFETLTYDASQTREGVEAILYGSFMQGSNKPSTDPSYTYAQLIVKAGTETGVSPYHIASRIRQEVGSTNGVVTNGKHAQYPGIYNFYNIGAFDSSSGDAPTKALRWASTPGSYGRPWNTVYKSIRGGALFIGEEYIFKGQNTLYTQKFNVTNKSSLYSHQYMTNVQAVETEAAKVYTAYSNAKMLDNPIVFSIPVYNNMPNAVTSQPADSGSPNNWLKSLTVSGYSLNFKPATTGYTLSVKSDVSSITISAAAVNSAAKVSGTGNVSLKTGTNKINIVVTAQNGSKRTYTLTVTRASSGNTGGNGNTSAKRGDMNGDGKISAIDIVYVQRLIVGVDKTNTTNLALGDINKDGKISAIDIVYIQRHIVGIETIKN